MAGMAVAWGTKAAMVPAGGVRSSIDARASAGAGLAAAAAVSGLGRMSLRRLQSNRLVVSSPTETRRSLTIVAVQTEETELVDVTDVQVEGAEIQVTVEEYVKKVTDTWEKVDDKLAIGTLGVFAIIALWGSNGLISAIEKLPIIPQLLELVGLLYTGWFIYRYLLFKPDREELLKTVGETKSKITGQNDL